MGRQVLMSTFRKLLYFFTLILLLLKTSFGQETVENNFNIKTGISINKMSFQTSFIPSNPEGEKHSESTGFGFNTSVGFKWNTWEAMVTSDVLYGSLKDITFFVNSKEISGNGHLRIFTLSPLLRYYTPYSLYNRWNFYTSAGPVWSLFTFIFKSTTEGNFSNDKRLSFENRGAILNFGVEEIVPYKEAHPSFFEIGYSYIQSHRIFVVDASDFKDVKTLQRDNSKDFKGHYFIFRFGITLF